MGFILVSVSVLWLLNYAGLLLLGVPVVYCTGGALLRPVLTPYASVLLLSASAYLFYCLMRYGVGVRAMLTIGTMMLIAGFPQFSATLFMANGKCG